MPDNGTLVAVYRLVRDAPVVWIDLEPLLGQKTRQVLPEENSSLESPI